MSDSDPSEDPWGDDPDAAPRGPTDYRSVPLLRRNGFCSGVLVAHVGVMFLGGCVPLVSLMGVFTTVGVIAVCVVVLTGPVYYDKRKKDGALKTWSRANKVAAVVLLLLFVGGYAALIYFLVSNGKFG